MLTYLEKKGKKGNTNKYQQSAKGRMEMLFTKQSVTAAAETLRSDA
jgi:hypothetical protein